MKVFLMLAAVLSLFLGILFIFSLDTVTKLSEFFNRQVVVLDHKLHASSKLTGIILLVLGILMCYVALWG